MPNNNENTKKARRKTNNSQSAGMSSGTSNVPVATLSVPQGAPPTDAFPEAVYNDMRRKSESILDAPSGEQVVEPFEDPGEQEEGDSRSDYSLGLGEFGELTELGNPYQASDLPRIEKFTPKLRSNFLAVKHFRRMEIWREVQGNQKMYFPQQDVIFKL